VVSLILLRSIVQLDTANCNRCSMVGLRVSGCWS